MASRAKRGKLRGDWLERFLVGTYIIWLRDVKRFWRDTMRRIGAFVQPLIYLFLLGTGLQSAFRVFGAGETKYVTFMYPGILAMTVLFTSMFSSISIIWDREFGFLKEMTVAPIPRSSIAMGKILGGATTAVLQGIVFLVFMPLAGIPYGLYQVFMALLVMSVLSLALTSLGVLIAARMRSMEGFPIVMNFILMPMFFLSGAMFPLQGLPGWMDFLTKVNPMSYGVDAMRNVVLRGVALSAGNPLGNIPPEILEKLAASGVDLPTSPQLRVSLHPLHVDLLVVLGVGIFLFLLSSLMFGRQD
jgi:ABC-2 type transport system permease protein